MPVVKCSLFLNTFNMGASESYLSPDTALPQVAAQLGELLQFRRGLMWTNHNFVGVRVSLQPNQGQLLIDQKIPRQSQLLLPGDAFWDAAGTKVVVPKNGIRAGAGKETRPDQWRAVAQFTVGFNNTRRTIRYLSGIPDQFSGFEPGTIDNQGVVPETWIDSFNSLQRFLTGNGWQIKARTGQDLDIVSNVAGLHSEAALPHRLGIVMPLVPDPAWVKGTKIHLSGFRRKDNSKITLNGNYYIDGKSLVDVPGQIVFYLRGVLDQNPENWKVLGTVQRVRFSYFPMQSMNLYRVGIHKRGRPSLSPVGRRPTRVTLDP